MFEQQDLMYIHIYVPGNLQAACGVMLPWVQCGLVSLVLHTDAPSTQMTTRAGSRSSDARWQDVSDATMKPSMSYDAVEMLPSRSPSLTTASCEALFPGGLQMSSALLFSDSVTFQYIQMSAAFPALFISWHHPHSCLDVFAQQLCIFCSREGGIAACSLLWLCVPVQNLPCNHIDFIRVSWVPPSMPQYVHAFNHTRPCSPRLHAAPGIDSKL